MLVIYDIKFLLF